MRTKSIFTHKATSVLCIFHLAPCIRHTCSEEYRRAINTNRWDIGASTINELINFMCLPRMDFYHVYKCYNIRILFSESRNTVIITIMVKPTTTCLFGEHFCNRVFKQRLKNLLIIFWWALESPQLVVKANESVRLKCGTTTKADLTH